jgi:hypothetical protein
LIQLGDILDRGEDEIAILSLLRSLNKQAKAKGGAVFQVCNLLLPSFPYHCYDASVFIYWHTLARLFDRAYGNNL